MNPRICPFQFHLGIGERRCFNIFVGLFFTISLMAQPANTNNNHLQKEIEFTNKLLKSTSQKRNATLEEYLILETKVRSRKRLIQTLSGELQATNEKILALENSLQKATTELDRQRHKYASLVRNAFHDKISASSIQFLLSSEDLNDAFQRLNYLKQVEKFRKDQVVAISNYAQELKVAQKALEEGISEKKNIIDAADNQSKLIKREQALLANLFNDLKAQEEHLAFELREKKAANRNMDSQLEATISNEEALATRVSNKKSFSAFRSKLPWPVKEGVISQHFGIHDHPTLKNIKVQNNGIDIATANNEPVVSVFDGIVMAVSKVAGFGETIIVKHDDYYSVYSKLTNVKVRKGQSVQMGEPIAAVITKNGYSTLHFEIWNRKERENPAKWIQLRD